MSIDPRARALAKARQDMAGRSSSLNPGWDDLPEQSKKILLGEATEWLQAAVEAGIAPLAERPTDKHDAVLLDNYGQVWGEYQTYPPSYGDAILRLTLESDECSSRQELEDQGVEFRLIGWSE
ncbi:hypothetical protein ABZ797_33420 [Streptomyces antimycoticus]|uniref:Immunity protein 35 domain-containing protein n=1 Tax=Streptomyces mordarskii TaxID=1226758 RepID=A0ABP3NVL7_9ACTN